MNKRGLRTVIWFWSLVLTTLGVIYVMAWAMTEWLKGNLTPILVITALLFITLSVGIYLSAPKDPK